MINTQWLLSIALLTLLPVSSSYAFDEYDGHDEITRQAFDLAKSVTKKDFTTARGSMLDGAENGFLGALTRGNQATDNPVDDDTVVLWDYWHLAYNGAISWQFDGSGQVQHSLRNKTSAGDVETALNTCNQVRANIISVTTDALHRWRADKVAEAVFLFGHVTHMIQDSFSSAHTLRLDRQHNFDLANICQYAKSGTSNDAIQPCIHKTMDGRDRVWLNSSQVNQTKVAWLDEDVSVCTPDHSDLPESTLLKCLTHEARLAKLATARYLAVVDQLISTDASDADVSATLKRLLLDGVDEALWGKEARMSNGIYRCNLLGDGSK